METVYAQYVGNRKGAFTVTGLTRRAYRISLHQPIILIDARDAGLFDERRDFRVLGTQVTRPAPLVDARAGPPSMAESLESVPLPGPARPNPSRRIQRSVDERRTTRVTVPGL